MKINYNSLKYFLSENPSKNLLSEKLFQLGHEHEVSGDIFDMELTPNRGDCLSLIGMARDLNIFFGMSNENDIYNGDIEPLNLNFENLSPNDCPKISFLEIEINEEVSEYKSYLEEYFLVTGNKKTNFFSDISNYLSYEQGQPTHCFDRDKIPEKLIFENKTCNESFVTLLENKINLEGENCIFRSGNEIISLAGVMGGKSTACSSKTTKALVECAYFNPESIIGKTIKYNLNSDAAYKFERGVDIQSQERVLRRFIKIVQDHVPIKKIKINTFIEKQYKEIHLPIDVERINAILGIKLTEDKYLNYLSKLGFIIGSQIQVPSYRHDICNQNDLAEEIARVIGYDEIDSSPVKLKKSKIEGINKIEKIKNLLTKNGFSEVINFPFTTITSEEESILIDNPLDSSKKNLRTSLKESLLENLLYNERRQKESIKLFEISDIYLKGANISQEKRLGLIISGRVDENYIDYSKKLDDIYLKNILNNSEENIEEISRENIKTKRKDRIFYTEVEVDRIPDELLLNEGQETKPINFSKYEPVSEYPSSKRDFSFSITRLEKYDEVIDAIRGFQDHNLKKFFIFDFFKNKKSNEVKIGVSLIFQSPLKTLSEDEIQDSITKLLNPIIQIDGVSIPGLDI